MEEDKAVSNDKTSTIQNKNFKISFYKNINLWLTVINGAILIFSSIFAVIFQNMLNEKQFKIDECQQISKTISEYIFITSDSLRLAQHHLIDKQVASNTIDLYRHAYTQLQSDQFYYDIIINKYWGKNAVAAFDKEMSLINDLNNYTSLIAPTFEQRAEGYNTTINPSKLLNFYAGMNKKIINLKIQSKYLLEQLNT